MYEAIGLRDDLLPDTAHGCEQVPMASDAFFHAMEATTPPPHLYFTAPVAQLDPALLSHADGLSALAAAVFDSDEQAHDGDQHSQLWACSAGAFTQAHYDVSDNLFIQLHGEKEFSLYPPAAARALHLHPDSHPRARKAQLCLAAPDLAVHPEGAALPPPLRLLLRPGDCIFIPAFTFHHVVSTTPTVSINVFSTAGVPRAAAAPLAVPLPLHAGWPAELKRRGLGCAEHHHHHHHRALARATTAPLRLRQAAAGHLAR
jgi:hypothetical protein